MYSSKDLSIEIQKELDIYLAKGQPVSPDWLATAILARKVAAEGPDAEFYSFCASSHVRAAVGARVRSLKPGQKIKRSPCTEQLEMVLEGYEHVLQAYLIERDGEQVIVPTLQLTDEEVYAKMAELEAMKTGLDEHIIELGNFVLRRKKIFPLPA